jgi:hypothetical protein
MRLSWCWHQFFRIRIRIGYGFNQVSGSGFGIRIRIQEGINDPQKKNSF